MGFDWSISIGVQFTQPVEVPSYRSRLVKRLIQWSPAITPGELAQRELGGRKRSHRAAKAASMLPASDAPINDDDTDGVNHSESTDPWGFSDVEDEESFTEEQEALMRRLKATCAGNGAPSHHPDATFDLDQCPEIVTEAFAMAATKLLGDGHGVELELERGGAYGEADEGASDVAMRLTYAPSQTYAGGSIDVSRGGINVPWGVKCVPIKTLAPDEERAVRATMARVCAAFGFAPVGDAALRLCTTASGG